MRAQFLSRFEHAGKDVYSYLDLDTQEIVWLEGGRSGPEIRRWPKMELTAPRGRAIDYLPKSETIRDLIDKYHNKPRGYLPYQHDHWAS